MKLSFEYEGNKISYDLTYKKRGSIAIQVEENGEIKVCAPVGTPIFTVIDKVKGNAQWIAGELLRIKRAQEFANHCMYLGKNYGIEFVEDETKGEAVAKLSRGKFVIEGQGISKETMIAPLYKWYQAKTLTKLKERLKLYSEHFETVPKKLHVQALGGRLWVIQDEELAFDVNMGVGPVNLMDCVLVEALCRLNNIEDSNSKLDELVADVEQAREWINANKDRFIFK